MGAVTQKAAHRGRNVRPGQAAWRVRSNRMRGASGLLWLVADVTGAVEGGQSVRIFMWRVSRVSATGGDEQPVPDSSDATGEQVVWDTRGSSEEDPLPASAVAARFPGLEPGRWYRLEDLKTLYRGARGPGADAWMSVSVSVSTPDGDLPVEIQVRQEFMMDSILSEVLEFATQTADERAWWIRVE